MLSTNNYLNFTKFVNQHIKRLASKTGLGKDISTYWVRYSFSNTMLKNGAIIELSSESVGHWHIKTTANYLSGYKVEKKQEMAEKLMDFMKEPFVNFLQNLLLKIQLLE